MCGACVSFKIFILHFAKRSKLCNCMDDVFPTESPTNRSLGLELNKYFEFVVVSPDEKVGDFLWLQMHMKKRKLIL